MFYNWGGWLSIHKISCGKSSHLQFFTKGKHFVVHQNGEAEVEGRWDAGDEVERGELAWQLLHGKDHLVDLYIRE